MDPLVDEYRKLDKKEEGKINPEVMQKSIHETRVFLVEVAMSAVLLFVTAKSFQMWSVQEHKCQYAFYW